MKTQLTKELRKKGYNCAQAVLCTYKDDLGMSMEDLLAFSEAFGLGMGVMSVCGAVSAMCMVASLKTSDKNIDNPKSKAQTYKICKELISRFEEKNKSIICKELKGVTTGTPLRSCDGCIMDAVDILEEYFL